MKIVKFLRKIHKITASAIAVFFLMWFVSGLILLYHPYPRVTEDIINDKKEELPSSLPSITSIQQSVGQEIRGLSLKQFQGQTLISVSTKDGTKVLNADSTQKVKPITFNSVEKVASRWVDAPILRVDTLHEREQWILYSRYDKVMPIYKFYFDDNAKTELFVSGKNGEVQQLTTRNERFWAWVGAIPHKFYIPSLRKHTEIWQNTSSIISGICLLAAISGWILAIYLWVNRYRKKRVWENPYKKRWYRWHFSFGMIFGIFLMAWALSGIFAMQKVPQWMVATEGEYTFKNSRLWGMKPLPISYYQLDYRILKEAYPDLKEVEWTHFGQIPAYRLVYGDRESYVDASGPNIKPLYIQQEIVKNGFQKIHGEDTPIRISLMNESDNYYLSRRLPLPLPVYKVEVEDGDHSVYYVSPETGYIRYMNKNKVLRKWLFNAIHYLDIDWLLARPWLWTICIWTLCIGCGVVCTTGVVLGYKMLFRKRRRRK